MDEYFGIQLSQYVRHMTSLIKVTKFASRTILGDPNLAYLSGFVSMFSFFSLHTVHGTVHGKVPFLSLSTKLRLVNLIFLLSDKIWLTGWLKVTNFDFLDGLSSIHFGPCIMHQYKDNLRFGVHHRAISSTFIYRCDKNWLTFVVDDRFSSSFLSWYPS